MKFALEIQGKIFKNIFKKPLDKYMHIVYNVHMEHIHYIREVML